MLFTVLIRDIDTNKVDLKLVEAQGYLHAAEVAAWELDGELDLEISAFQPENNIQLQ